ncbi:hypothetical protein D3C86_2015310 [compost metagenome]
MRGFDFSGFNNRLRLDNWRRLYNRLRFSNDLLCLFNHNGGSFSHFNWSSNDWLNGFRGHVLLFKLLFLRTCNRIADKDFTGGQFW